MKFQKIKLITVILCIVAMLAGCTFNGKEITLGNRISDEEVFKIDSSACPLGIAKLYMYTLKNQYESVYGSNIWKETYNGQTLEEYVKKTVISQLAKIKSMALFAKANEVELSEEEKNMVNKASQEFFMGLSQVQIEFFNLTQEDIYESYSEFLLASKIYSSLTTETDTEVSDDEARIMKIQQIVLHKYHTDESGNITNCTQEELSEIYSKAATVIEKAKNGEDFMSLAESYSDDSNYELSVGRGKNDENVEKIIFNMENEQISDIIETNDSYYIIKCINSYDIEATDANKAVIVEQRKVKAFDEVYEVFVEGLSSVFNDKVWDTMAFEENADVNTVNYFDIYNQYFG